MVNHLVPNLLILLSLVQIDTEELYQQLMYLLPQQQKVLSTILMLLVRHIVDMIYQKQTVKYIKQLLTSLLVVENHLIPVVPQAVGDSAITLLQNRKDQHPLHKKILMYLQQVTLLLLLMVLIMLKYKIDKLVLLMGILQRILNQIRNLQQQLDTEVSII